MAKDYYEAMTVHMAANPQVENRVRIRVTVRVRSSSLESAIV
jgi:hypothetical protein